jgi:hypothetical protein
MNPLDIDTRVTCTACRHFTGKECKNPHDAGLALTYGKAEVGPALAALKQRCFGFAKKPIKESST